MVKKHDFGGRRLIPVNGVLRCWRRLLERGGRVRGGVKNSNNEPMKPRNEPEASVNHRWTPMNRDTARRLNRREQRERRLAAREHKEHERSRIPWVRSGRKTGGDGKRWVGKRAFPTLSGQEIGKWCSFSHLETALTRLFPHVSTQVVDFPHLSCVRLFWERARIGFSAPEREVTI